MMSLGGKSSFGFETAYQENCIYDLMSLKVIILLANQASEVACVCVSVCVCVRVHTCVSMCVRAHVCVYVSGCIRTNKQKSQPHITLFSLSLYLMQLVYNTELIPTTAVMISPYHSDKTSTLILLHVIINIHKLNPIG